jgi:L-rhamnonate dehydratase
MKIIDVEAIHLRLPEVIARSDGTQDTLVVRVRTDAGIEGIGEVDSSPLVAKAVIEAPMSHQIARGLRDCVLGTDPLDIAVAWRRMYEGSLYFGRGGAAMHAMSGIDIALWDIAGKALGQPVHRLLGGRFHDRLRAYGSILFADTPAGTYERARRLRDEGFPAVKFGWGPLGADERSDREQVRQARRGLGEDVELMIDAGQCYDAATALSRARAFAEHRPTWFEEPVHPDDLDGYRRLAEQSPIAIAGGEEEATFAAFERLIGAGIAVVQPDITRVGGPTGAMEIGRLAARHHRLVVNHSYKTGINIAASLHVLAALPNTRWFEYCVETSPLRTSLTRERFPVVDGCIAVPTEPGLGITLDDDVVARYRVG